MTTVPSNPNTQGTTNATPVRAWAALVLGVLIFLVPFAFSATGAAGYTSFAYSNYVTGGAVVILAAISIWAARNSLMTLAWLEGANALLGIWTIIAPFVYATTSNAMISNVVLGVILVVDAGWDSYVGMTGRSGTMRTTRGRTV